MLLLQKGTANTNQALTLTENSTLASPVYLFVFSKGGNDYPVICTDLATTAQKARTNLFTITEGADDPTNGSLILGTTGVYDLIVYEQSSTTNLDPANSTGIVMTTLARLTSAASEAVDYIAHQISVSYTEHQISL